MHHVWSQVLDGNGRRNIEYRNQTSKRWQWMCFQEKAVKYFGSLSEGPKPLFGAELGPTACGRPVTAL